MRSSTEATWLSLSTMRRREFIMLVGWPLVPRAQPLAMPVIGFLSARSPDGSVPHVAAFHQGLAEAGFVDGRNLRIEFRWAHGQYVSFPFWRPISSTDRWQ